MSCRGARRLSPKLRTKSGCFMCRKRRKKCDEVKPLCSSCRRFGLECVWPVPPVVPDTHTKILVSGPGTATTTTIIMPNRPSLSQLETTKKKPPLFSDDSSKISFVRSAVYGLPGVKTSAEHYLSLYFIERFMPILIRQNTHPSYTDHSLLMSVGVEESTAMNGFFALAALHASYKIPKFKSLAVKYYNSVVASLGRVIDGKKVRGDETWLLVTANFLCVFELNQGWNAIGTSAATSHLEGIARMINLRLEKCLQHPGTPIDHLSRIVSEAWVYQVSTINLLYADIDRVDDLICWEEWSMFLEHELFPGAPSYVSSPILGMNWKVYRTGFDIVRLSHIDLLSPAEYAKGQALEAESLRQEEETQQELEECRSHIGAYNLLQQTLFRIFSAQILIFKVLRPETRTWHPRIRELVRKVLDIAKDGIMPNECTPYFQWPVAIVSCAITEEEDMFLIRRILEKMWDNSYCGEVKRLRKAVEVFWKSARIKKRGETHLGDLLDVLINSGGLFNHPYLSKQ